MRKRRRRGPTIFAEEFSFLLAREGLRIGKIACRRTRTLVEWAERLLRDPDLSIERAGWSVARKLLINLYPNLDGLRLPPEKEMKRLKKVGVAFARRHRSILAEQVLSATEPKRGK